MVQSMLYPLPNIRLQADPGWKLEAHFPYTLGVMRVSAPYRSHVWSKLLIPVHEGTLQGGVGGNYEGFDMDTGANAVFRVAEKGVI